MRTWRSLVRLCGVIVIVWAMLVVGLGRQLGPTELLLMVVAGLGVGIVQTARIMKRRNEAQTV